MEYAQIRRSFQDNRSRVSVKSSQVKWEQEATSPEVAYSLLWEVTQKRAGVKDLLNRVIKGSTGPKVEAATAWFALPKKKKKINKEKEKVHVFPMCRQLLCKDVSESRPGQG